MEKPVESRWLIKGVGSGVKENSPRLLQDCSGLMLESSSSSSSSSSSPHFISHSSAEEGGMWAGDQDEVDAVARPVFGIQAGGSLQQFRGFAHAAPRLAP